MKTLTTSLTGLSAAAAIVLGGLHFAPTPSAPLGTPPTTNVAIHLRQVQPGEIADGEVTTTVYRVIDPLQPTAKVGGSVATSTKATWTAALPDGEYLDRDGPHAAEHAVERRRHRRAQPGAGRIGVHQPARLHVDQGRRQHLDPPRQALAEPGRRRVQPLPAERRVRLGTTSRRPDDDHAGRRRSRTAARRIAHDRCHDTDDDGRRARLDRWPIGVEAGRRSGRDRPVRRPDDADPVHGRRPHRLERRGDSHDPAAPVHRDRPAAGRLRDRSTPAISARSPRRPSQRRRPATSSGCAGSRRPRRSPTPPAGPPRRRRSEPGRRRPKPVETAPVSRSHR